MSRRDTIIIAVLINACLLIILFATAITKKEDSHYSSNRDAHDILSPAPIKIENIQKDLVKEVVPPTESFELSRPTLPPARSEPIASVSMPQVEVKPTPDALEITVKRGDFLEKIAKENGTSVDTIMKLNQLSTTQLRVGQVLKVPARGLSANSAIVSNLVEKQYTIKSGDTIWQIANEHNMQVSELLKINHLNNESAKRLKPGDVLIIR